MDQIKKIAIRKAQQSECCYRISAVGLNKRGEVIGSTFNKIRLPHFRGGLHAEIDLIRRYGKNLKTIVICRVNRTGKVCKIDPCPNCKKVADKLGIKIISVEEEKDKYEK